MARFYVYEHWRLDTDVCFYVGKGCGTRAYWMYGRNRHHKSIQRKLEREGSALEVRIVSAGLDEVLAHALEIDRIAFWRSVGVKLANATDGGEGVSGLKMSDAAKARMRAKKVGRLLSVEHKAKIGAAHRGRKPSPQNIEAVRRAQTGKLVSEAAKLKMSESAKRRKGRLVSEETKEKIRAPLMGHGVSEATKEKMRAAHLDYSHKFEEGV
jgi:hypothetical protein